MLVKIAAAGTACACIGLAALVVSPGNAASIERRDNLTIGDRASEGDTEMVGLQDRFPDAPYGVDPIVTGPVSTAFAQKRKALACDDAVWPRVPAGCYPD